jgi:hypothetical protein
MVKMFIVAFLYKSHIGLILVIILYIHLDGPLLTVIFCIEIVIVIGLFTDVVIILNKNYIYCSIHKPSNIFNTKEIEAVGNVCVLRRCFQVAEEFVPDYILVV